MTPSTPQLGYVILYVSNVDATLRFYEEAFGLTRRFFNDEEGKAYGELDTGAARLAFASFPLVREHLAGDVVPASPDGIPLGMEVALVTTDVEGAYRRAVAAGARSVAEPAVKPWGQTVAYVRDANGFLVELCTAMP